jgi:hypothetical protein
VTDYGLDDQNSIPARAYILLSAISQDTVAMVIPASCPIDDGLFFMVKEAGTLF